jgi:DNA ligase-1
MLEADLGRAAESAFAGTLADARMRLFHPLGFMLASPVETPEEAVDRFTEKPAKVEKPRKLKRRGKAAAPEDIAPTNAAEQGLAEDVEIESQATPADASLLASVSALSGADFSGAEVLHNSATPTGLVPANADAEIHQQPAAIHALIEDKYDGMRAQLHFGDPEQLGRVAIYSRNREDVTASFPELEEAFRGAAQAGAVILDGEILGWDYAVGKALPFAVLGQRIGRKKVDNAMRKAIPVVFMAFDVMFADGDLVLPLPLRARRAKLEQIVAALEPVARAPLEHEHAVVPGGLFAADAGGEPRLMLSPAKMAESAEGIDAAYSDARARSNEGVMIKSAASAYLPGRRGLAWLKLKRELGTLDVVITGAEYGNGRRAGLLSDYTFAVKGPGGELLNVGKAYSGVTDAEIAELTEWLKAHTLEDHGHFRTVEPLRVLEVAFNNIMRSERHASGFALRFPRIVRVRDDKPVGEIDTLERVEEIFESQPDKAS